MVRVAVDAMGGDNAPAEIVKGCIQALKKEAEIQVLLVGKEELIRKELEKNSAQKDAGEDASYCGGRLKIVNATEVIETGDAPVASIRSKKDSSIVVGMKLVRNKEADAFVSAGSSGAILVGGQVIVGRIKGIERAPFAPILPTDNGGVTLLLDAGANVDARSSHLKQFAQMGAIYMEHALGIKSPKVAILNVGLEEEKGNALVKETYPLLKQMKEEKGMNFIGSIEAREVTHGYADVCVCEGFTGNMVLKMMEGTASSVLKLMKKAMVSNLRSKIGALLLKPALKTALADLDGSKFGGAPMLGLNGLVVKTHGNAKANEICNALMQCKTFHEEKINEFIAKETGVGA